MKRVKEMDGYVTRNQQRRRKSSISKFLQCIQLAAAPNVREVSCIGISTVDRYSVLQKLIYEGNNEERL
jgi:hypothetical protein